MEQQELSICCQQPDHKNNKADTYCKNSECQFPRLLCSLCPISLHSCCILVPLQPYLKSLQENQEELMKTCGQLASISVQMEQSPSCAGMSSDQHIQERACKMVDRVYTHYKQVQNNELQQIGECHVALQRASYEENDPNVCRPSLVLENQQQIRAFIDCRVEKEEEVIDGMMLPLSYFKQQILLNCGQKQLSQENIVKYKSGMSEPIQNIKMIEMKKDT